MNNKTKTKTIPNLRFPEFRNAGPWNLATLDSPAVSTFVADKVSPIDLKLDSYISTENMLPDFGGVRASSNLPTSGSLTSFLQEDILMSNIRPYLRKIWRSDKSGASSNDIIVFRAGIKVSPKFLEQVLKSDTFINYVMKDAAGVKMPRGDKNSIKKYPVAFPHNNEQAKIADCLSSLDDLISAQNDKVENLKNYKNVLLHQLFPQDGETIPRLRFPEFKKDGDWILTELGTMIEEFREKSTVQDEFKVFTSSRSGLVWQTDFFGEGRLTERDNIGFNVVPPNYITYRSRSDDRCFYFNENKQSVSGIISIYYPVFRITNGSNGFFIALTTRFSDIIGKYSVGNAQTVLSLTVLKKIKLPVPANPKEQYRISYLLGSIDELIDSEREKFSCLQNHKKGLLQQLFPSPIPLAKGDK